MDKETRYDYCEPNLRYNFAAHGSVILLHNKYHNGFVQMIGMNCQTSKIRAWDKYPSSWEDALFTVVHTGEDSVALHGQKRQGFMYASSDGKLSVRYAGDEGPWTYNPHWDNGASTRFRIVAKHKYYGFRNNGNSKFIKSLGNVKTMGFSEKVDHLHNFPTSWFESKFRVVIVLDAPQVKDGGNYALWSLWQEKFLGASVGQGNMYLGAKTPYLEFNHEWKQ